MHTTPVKQHTAERSRGGIGRLVGTSMSRHRLSIFNEDVKYGKPRGHSENGCRALLPQFARI